VLVLGVDIAARKGGHNCGLGLIDAELLTALERPCDDLLWTRSIDGTSLSSVAAVVAQLAELGAQRGRPVLLVLERQFLKLDPGTFEKLIASRVRFEVVAEVRRVPCETMGASTWQTILDLLGSDCPKKPAKPRKGAAKPQQELLAAPRMIRDTKAAARMLCDRLYPAAKLTKDECDAVLMARFAAWRRRPAA
jgi:hypothetical protein